MTKREYCRSWFWANRSTSDPITEDEARKRHKLREQYTVAVGGFEAPSAIIEVVNDFVAVSFLDRLLREFMTLHFQEKKPGLLFMSMATRRVYCEPTNDLVDRLRLGPDDPSHSWGRFIELADRVLDGRSVIFREDGSTFHRASRHGDSRILEVPGPKWSVSGNWEPYPKFGHYDHLLNQHRPVPWGPGIDDA